MSNCFNLMVFESFEHKALMSFGKGKNHNTMNNDSFSFFTKISVCSLTLIWSRETNWQVAHVEQTLSDSFLASISSILYQLCFDYWIQYTN